jgi:hypothetical protein
MYFTLLLLCSLIREFIPYDLWLFTKHKRMPYSKNHQSVPCKKLVDVYSHKLHLHFTSTMYQESSRAVKQTWALSQQNAETDSDLEDFRCSPIMLTISKQNILGLPQTCRQQDPLKCCNRHPNLAV